MKKRKQINIRCYYSVLFFTIAVLFISFFLSSPVKAQNYRVINPEAATCQVSLSTKVTESGGTTLKGASKATGSREVMKTHKPGLNQIGHFNQISNVQPNQKVLIEVAYPNAKIGDKLLVAVVDGGTFEDKGKVKVMQLNSQRKLSFNFYAASDPGIYRILLRKGSDSKVVQLWVGAEPIPVKDNN